MLLSESYASKIYLSEVGAATTRSATTRAFDEGASLVSYIGHGGIQLWADENIFNIWDVSSLAVRPQQPLLLTMNCFFSACLLLSPLGCLGAANDHFFFMAFFMRLTMMSKIAPPTPEEPMFPRRPDNTSPPRSVPSSCPPIPPPKRPAMVLPIKPRL
jgi:hypothetical protein